MRAPRFSLQIPLRYRAAGQSAWHLGQTENISLSGVLFLGQQPLKPDTPVEMSFSVRSELFHKTIGIIICTGRVVRTEPRPGAVDLTGLAAKISNHHFLAAKK